MLIVAKAGFNPKISKGKITPAQEVKNQNVTPASLSYSFSGMFLSVSKTT